MSVFKKLLIACDLSPQSTEVIKKAVALGKLAEAEIHIVHVVEPVPVTSFGFAGIVDMEVELIEKAQVELNKLAVAHDIAEANQSIEVGPAKQKIIDKANDLQADLIILGTHGHHGISVLLGSTANSVAHNADCDVMVVRMSE